MLKVSFPRRELSTEETIRRIADALQAHYPDTRFSFQAGRVGEKPVNEITYTDGPKREKVYQIARRWGCKHSQRKGDDFTQGEDALTITPLGLEVVYSTACIVVERFHTLPRIDGRIARTTSTKSGASKP